MLRLSWALALSFTFSALVGILILTRDLSITNDLFKDGVAQAKTIDHTTDDAVQGVANLGPADAAINQSMPEVVGVIDSLTRADHTLGTLADQLQALAAALTSVDAPLAGIIQVGGAAGDQADKAADQAARIGDTLGQADAHAQLLGQRLDQTLSLSATIDSKLRIALLLPKVGG
ncbi:hypothetical protein ACFWF7_29805 [Nocardia sp. NPDC060256]|uniref:hypothetical protein n=1 Tax=unclassified Nocardia TaxID=2637762 RepID=UPI0036581744